MTSTREAQRDEPRGGRSLKSSGAAITRSLKPRSAYGEVGCCRPSWPGEIHAGRRKDCDP